jgi:hypothetical protein
MGRKFSILKSLVSERMNTLMAVGKKDTLLAVDAANDARFVPKFVYVPKISLDQSAVDPFASGTVNRRLL